MSKNFKNPMYLLLVLAIIFSGCSKAPSSRVIVKSSSPSEPFPTQAAPTDGSSDGGADSDNPSINYEEYAQQRIATLLARNPFAYKSTFKAYFPSTDYNTIYDLADSSICTDGATPTTTITTAQKAKYNSYIIKLGIVRDTIVAPILNSLNDKLTMAQDEGHEQAELIYQTAIDIFTASPADELNQQIEQCQSWLGSKTVQDPTIDPGADPNFPGRALPN